jgi:DNA invertase Pin-like site-specific DNA recombinase
VRFGRRPTLTPGQVEHARDLLSQGRTAAQTAELLGVHRATLYRALGGQETSQAEARRRGAFVEDALTEADALAAADQEGTKA